MRSGIADYSADLLPHLAQLCDLRLVNLPGQPVDRSLGGRFPLVPPERLGEDGRLPLYQMGNNQHHTAVYELAVRSPGVLTLHDLVLHHFLIDRTVKEGDFEGYRRQLLADHGWVGEAAAMPMRWPGGSGMAAQFALPAHRSLLLCQRGILTHSRWTTEVLHEEIPSLRVQTVPMGIPLGSAVDPEAGRSFRRRRGLPLDRPMLGSFGFQTPMKRTDVVIRALAAPELQDAHLMVAGEVASILRLQETAAEVGVSERVHVLGFLPFEEFEAAIAACDLCLNLRYPTAGETSASLLRVLAIGKPAVVSDYAQSAELPPEGVVKVPVGEGESAALRERLAALLADRTRLEEMGHAARRHVEHNHRPEDAARAMASACRAFRSLPPPDERGTAERGFAEPPPTSLVWSSLPGEIEVAGAERPWPGGQRRQVKICLRNRSAARWLAGRGRPAGGLALEVRIQAGERELPTKSGWIPMPLDLEPGEEYVFEVALRRPLGPARLRVLPHIFDHGSFAELGGPVWEADI